MASNHVASKLFIFILFACAFLYPEASAEVLHYYPGPDTGTGGMVLTDFKVMGSSDGSGETYLVSFVLTNQLDNPTLTLTGKGIFIVAIDPGGNPRYYECSYPGETLPPGSGLIFVGSFSPDMAGEWVIWPSYEIVITGSDSIYSSTIMGPEYWHPCSINYLGNALPDLVAESITINPDGLVAGAETEIVVTVANIGEADSSECSGAFFVEDSLWSSFPIPAIDHGSSVDVVINWVPPFPDDRYHVVFIDYWDSVVENNEGNNIYEFQTEVSEAKVLEIIAQPLVVDITESSATIVWETNEPCSGTVEYGVTSRRYSSETSEAEITGYHRVLLTDLMPSTTYHFIVYAQDMVGRVSSRDQLFQTLPIQDIEPPRISLFELGIFNGTSTLQVDVQDEGGVERVEFYLNDIHMVSDYSEPFGFTLDTSLFEDGVYRLTTKAFDFSGQSTSQSKDIEFLNILDKTAPTVDIIFPQKDDKVSGEIQVTANLGDDTGLGQLFFRVDGVFESFQGFPSNPKTSKVSLTLDTTTLSVGRHRLSVEAFDKDGKYGYDTVDVWVSQMVTPDPPSLKVKSHSATRKGNSFVISLSVENIGGSTASNVVIQDFLRCFQPISGDDVNADYMASFTPSTMYGDTAIISKMVIPSKQSITYSFQAVPVLIHPESEYGSPTPSIGDPLKLWYTDQDGKNIYEETKQPIPTTSNGEAIQSSYNNALKTADYLIVTNPQRLGFYSKNEDVDELLSTMAKLAKYRNGVLGYTTWRYVYYEQVLQGLFKSGGSWSKKLADDWCSDGYLLLVGETEIIPSWNRVIGTFYTTMGDYTWKVDTDNPYANTYGDEKKPELNIARVIGSNAKELTKVIETSLNVFLKEPGYGFDRSNALLVSGFPSNLMGGFDAQVNAVLNSIKKTTPNTATDKINTPDYAQYNPSTGKINENYTNLVVDNVFFGATYSKDIIFLAGHGNWNSWDKIDVNDVNQETNPFGWSNPFIFASSCKTGIYTGVKGISEAFLQKGAAVYLGATESGGWTSYSTKFFDSWGLDEPISKAVKQVKASLGNDAQDKIWINVYHVYGDAKYGTVPSTTQVVSYTPVVAEEEAPIWIDVMIPEFEITSIGEAMRITIPGGSEYHETGRPLVPSYEVTYSYPKDVQIQDVHLETSSTPILLDNIELQESILEIATLNDQPIQSSDYSGIWPMEKYQWIVQETPTANILTITIYPLIYDGETHSASYTQEYNFKVDYTYSILEITDILLEKSVYEMGDEVSAEIQFQSSGNENVVFEAYIEDTDGLFVDGLLLRTLNGLSGKGSYEIKWDSADQNPGYYNLVAMISDGNGFLLDKSVQGFTLGYAVLETTQLTITPSRFVPGEDVEIGMTIHNSGELETSGVAYIKVFDSSGMSVLESAQEFNTIAPGESREFHYTWEQGGSADGVNRVIAYAMYLGGSSLPLVKLVGRDDAPPVITFSNLSPGQVVKKQVIIQTQIMDEGEVYEAAYSIQAGDQHSKGEKIIEINASYQGGNLWQNVFNTSMLPDGVYTLRASAHDAFGNKGETSTVFSISNAPQVNILTQIPETQLWFNEDPYRSDENGYLKLDAVDQYFNIKAQSIVYLSNHSRAVFLEWEDGTTSNPRTVTANTDITIMARYTTQHQLTVASAYGDPVGGGWYDEGSEATVSIPSRFGLIPEHVFIGWSGDIDEAADETTILMDAPKTVTAQWQTSYRYLLIILVFIAVAAVGIQRVKKM
jgi:hypothetical protein